MSWYDYFASMYDASLEKHYVEQRAIAAAALEPAPDSLVLDAPCGTGQSFGPIASHLGPGGGIVGFDLSAGMVRQAAKRIARTGAARTHAGRGDAASLALADVAAACGAGARPDRLHVFLGMSVFPAMDATFANLWGLLAPGGRCVLVDVYAEKPGLQGRMVQWVAGADITRRFWEPLAAVGEGFALRDLPSKPLHGGVIKLASARKPAG